MKKLSLLFFAIVLIACSPQKIAYIDVAVLMEEYSATKSLEAVLKVKQDKIAKMLDSLQAPFQLKVETYYKNASKMTAKKRAATEASLQQEQQTLQFQQQQATQILQAESQKNSEMLTKKVDSFVASYAQKNGYQLIMGTSGKGTVMYGDSKINITQNLLEILNADFEQQQQD